MQKDSTFLSRLVLVFGDVLAILFSFGFAYYFGRTSTLVRSSSSQTSLALW